MQVYSCRHRRADDTHYISVENYDSVLDPDETQFFERHDDFIGKVSLSGTSPSPSVVTLATSLLPGIVVSSTE